MHARFIKRLLKAVVKPIKVRMMSTASEGQLSAIQRASAAYCGMSYPVKVQLEKEKIEPLFTPELKALAEIFMRNGYELRLAGGAVRDLLMDKTPHDLDFATTATPEQMKEMFEKEGVRMINAKGEKHGTITPRINDKENFEVTTLRIDVRTDGRHADVEYTTDWKLDANRRDLTINSLFMDLNGTVYDFFNGIQDIKDRKVLFVGDAATRIREDYLRILRYFRFFGRISKVPDCHEESILQAMRDNLPGLAKISGERLWTELKKILEGNFAGELISVMVDLNITHYLGFTKTKLSMDEFKIVWQRLKGHDFNAITLFAGLVPSMDEAYQLNNRLKFSAFERDLLMFLVAHRKRTSDHIASDEQFPNEEAPDLSTSEDDQHPPDLHKLQMQIITSKFRPGDKKLWCVELLKYKGFIDMAAILREWQIPRFPINGHMVMENGCSGGKKLGLVLQRLKLDWCNSGFLLTSEELLAKIPAVLEDVENPRKRAKKSHGETAENGN